MEYTTLGSTGTTVSRLCLGCMSFGSSDWRDWVLDETESRAIIERAIDLGINFFDTANMYSLGESERILGRALDGHDDDWPVVATKVYHSMDDDNPNAQGLSRKAIEQELDHSLDRLGMDTIDLYQIHRWDDDTPIEETLRALDDAVRRGRVRHLGASSMWAYQFADALRASDTAGLDRFVTMQNHYNLAYREEEREMLPLCDREGIGVLPWSPLARGFLARPHEAADETTRGAFMDADGRMSDRVATYRANGGVEINDRVAELAAEKGVTMAQIALAWLLHRDDVTAPVVGTTSVEHLEAAVEALSIDLSDADRAYLEEPYGPVPVDGHT
jgi:aryl-alcohol dehydrogenase-like predicted oxidoreductase